MQCDIDIAINSLAKSSCNIECEECSLKRMDRKVLGEINESIYDTTRSIHSQFYMTPSKLKETLTGRLKHLLSIILIESCLINLPYFYTIYIIFSIVSGSKVDMRVRCSVPRKTKNLLAKSRPNLERNVTK